MMFLLFPSIQTKHIANIFLIFTYQTENFNVNRLDYFSFLGGRKEEDVFSGGCSEGGLIP